MCYIAFALWLPIESAPKDGTPIVCWREGWSRPAYLFWKTNPETAEILREFPEMCTEVAASYFGDSRGWDDVDFAHKSNWPTHWHPLDPLPSYLGTSEGGGAAAATSLRNPGINPQT